ncbi:hybrid sensor histidine kinase/response regulator [Catenovulum sediminis]|uniref:hybrid sensor histidine kinase/response regulator n=1 Tax=Catenovulum sediminis TaxID=1740262 RepID=UPI00163D8480|nr:PAS domain-containing hybrid sensor histidine kinase/response regulator [Catenovulum sediminis]
MARMTEHHQALLQQEIEYAYYRKNMTLEQSDWSDGMYCIYGVNQEIENPTFAAELKKVHPDDRSLLIDAYKNALNGHQFDIHYRIIKNDKELKVRNLATCVQENDGFCLYGCVIVEKVSAHNRVEKTAQAQQDAVTSVVENLSEPIIGINKKGAIKFFNRAAEKCFGYKRQQILNKNISLLMPDELAHHHNEFIARYLETGHTYVVNNERELTAVRKNGESFVMRLSVSVMPGIAQANADEIAFVGLIQDLTHHKVAESLMHKTTRLDVLSHLSGGIAHDVNNILNIISGHLEILQMQKVDDSAVLKRVTAALKGVERGRQLSNRLSCLSRVDEQDAEPCNLSLLIKDNEDLLSEIFDKSIDLSVDLQSDLRWIEIDPNHFIDTLINLCINANDAMPDGGQLIIRACNQFLDADTVYATGLMPGEHVKLTIKDSGIGITPEIQQRIFEPFYTTKGKDKGTGLGLSLAYNFIKDSRGHISVESEVGQGSCFTIYFPAIEEFSHPRNYNSTKVVDMDFEQSLRGKKILVVDDEQPILQLLSEFLKIYGLEVETANSGDQGLDLVKQEEFDLILSDLVMPGRLDGAQFAGEVLKSRPQSSIIFMSGYTDNRLSDNSELANIPIIHKPFRKKELLTQMQKMLH